MQPFHKVLYGCLALLIGLGVQTTAVAQEWHSLYSTLDLQQCEEKAAPPDPDGLPTSPVYLCRAHNAFPFEISDGDGRSRLSFGLNASAEKSAEQTLPPFNSLGKTIEWLYVRGKPGVLGMPYVAIVRYHLDAAQPGGQKGQVLAAIRTREGQVCHMAYVDARANQKANELIRKAAMDLYEGFDCNDEPRVIGAWQAY